MTAERRATNRVTDADVIARLRAKGVSARTLTIQDVEDAWVELRDERTPGWARYTVRYGTLRNGLRMERMERISDKYTEA